MPEFDELQRRESERIRHRENRGRQASVFAQYRTTGQGVVEFEDRLDFGLTFIHKPWVQVGHEIDMDAFRDALDLQDDDPLTYLPQVTGYVTEWDQDDKQNYVGCWVAVTVYFPPDLPVDAQIEIKHYFSLTAIGLKNIPVSFDD